MSGIKNYVANAIGAAFLAARIAVVNALPSLNIAIFDALALATAVCVTAIVYYYAFGSFYQISKQFLITLIFALTALLASQLIQGVLDVLQIVNPDFHTLIYDWCRWAALGSFKYLWN